MTLKKLTRFTKKVSDLADKPNSTMTAEEVKEQFDAAPEEVRNYLNQLIDDLTSVEGASSIGTQPIIGVTGRNVQSVLESLKSSINSMVLGEIPNGSITKEKLSFNTNVIEVRTTDPATPEIGQIWLRSDL